MVPKTVQTIELVTSLDKPFIFITRKALHPHLGPNSLVTKGYIVLCKLTPPPRFLGTLCHPLTWDKTEIILRFFMIRTKEYALESGCVCVCVCVCFSFCLSNCVESNMITCKINHGEQNVTLIFKFKGQGHSTDANNSAYVPN